MKQNSIRHPSRKPGTACPEGPITIGMDLGDKSSRYCVLGEKGEVVREGSVGTSKKAMRQEFSEMRRCRMAMEVGTHSPWVSRLLASLEYEVIVANAREVRAISDSSRKNDKLDARLLARLARVDPELLRPIQHRSEEAQTDLMTIRIRAALVEARTALINAGLRESAGGATAGVRHRQYGRGEAGGAAGPDKGTAEAVVGTSRNADGKDPPVG